MPIENPLNRLIVLLFAAAAVLPATQARAESAPSMYAVIVANNRSLDPEVAPLRFADDDGAKYYEMLEAAGADVTLLTVLDPDAQRRYTEAASVAVPPTKRALDNALDQVFDKIAEDAAAHRKSHFVFIYSGHGDVGPNREGYINLLDAKFRRSELFREVIQPSPATYNHIILDACHAYYMVNKRGGNDKSGNYADQVRSFLSAEELSRYPNTGVILAASSESETHEWGKWESGIFSHELRSALLGAGDVNQDGQVTYDEAAACVEAANSSIDVPKARLKVFYQAPAAKLDVPLISSSRFKKSAHLTVPANMAGKYYVEDSRGIRTADFNFSAEQPVRIALPGEAPFFLRTDDKEADIEGKKNRDILASNLTFREISSASRGSVEQSFRRDLYKTPFGNGFFKGMLAMRGEAPQPAATVAPQADAGPNRRPAKAAGWTLLGAGIAVGVAGGITYAAANSAFEDYKAAGDETTANGFKSDAENRLTASRVLIGVGAAAVTTGTILLIREAISKKKRERRRLNASAGNIEGGLYLGVSGTF